jgi:hypothetical protein
MIDVEGLTKDYGARRAIDNLTFNARTALEKPQPCAS